MRATGIVRRIDELGRIVIPKEIRRSLRLREGDPMEIFTGNDGEVVFKKYSPLGELDGIATDFASILHRMTEFGISVCDKDTVIISFGTGRGLQHQAVSDQLIEKIERRTITTAYRNNKEYPVPIIAGGSPEGYAIQIIAPIMPDGETVGAIIATLDTLPPLPVPMIETTAKMVESFAALLSKQMEA